MNTNLQPTQTPLVSVIIPVYNKVEYVEDCIRSVMEQNFENFEAIVVEDGSTDGSGTVCDSLANEYPNLTVLHPENGGVTAARRLGFDRSKGSFVTFVDADDKMLPGALQKLYDTILATGADEVVARYIDQHDNMCGSGGERYVDSDWMIKQLLASRADFCVLWAVLFKRELLKGCLDTPRLIRSGEDILMQIECLLKKPKVWFSDEVVYMYNAGLPNDRPLSLEEQKLYDDILLDLFNDDSGEFMPYIVLHQTKMYENFIHARQFDVFDKYYRLLRRSDKSRLSLADRIVVALPPRIAYYPVAWKKNDNHFPLLLIFCLVPFFVGLNSCGAMKKTAEEMMIESVRDPKTGAQVFTRDYDTEPYSINVGGIAKARKAVKKKKTMGLIDKY